MSTSRATVKCQCECGTDRRINLLAKTPVDWIRCSCRQCKGGWACQVYIAPVKKIQMSDRGDTDWATSPGFCGECENHQIDGAASDPSTKKRRLIDDEASSSTTELQNPSRKRRNTSSSKFASDKTANNTSDTFGDGSPSAVVLDKIS